MKKITRREFAVGTIAAGALAKTGKAGQLFTDEEKPDITSVTGPDARKNCRSAVTALGGMQAFVKPDQTVDILVNFVGRIPAAHTNPEMFHEVVALCKEAGAKRVRVISWIEENRRKQNKLQEEILKSGVEFHHVDQDTPALWQTMEVPRGEKLKQIRMMKVLFESDVLIMLPCFKHHGSANFTGSMKLFLAATPRQDNRKFMHQERSKYIEQCIAELNTIVRVPDLIVVDAMEILKTGGPGGPGNVVTPQKIIAGTDQVALDAYCAPLLDIDPAQSIQITKASALGIGESNLSKLNIKEINLA